MWGACILSPMQAEKIFDLSKYAHADLFKSGDYVWQALSNITAYLEAFPLGKSEALVDKGAYLVHPELISLGPGTVIEPGAYIKGPCILGSDCQVRHGAYIRGFVIAGDRCVIGHATEVKNSIFLDGALAAHFAYVGDSILGNETNLGAGTKCANLRFDGKEVTVKGIATQRRKLGLLMGDHAQTGCNAVTNPGTLIEKGTWFPKKR